MRHLAFLFALLACLLAAAWLEPMLRVRVIRRWRRLVLALTPTVVIFGLWDVAAILAGHWWYDGGQLIGLYLGPLPVEELLFFLITPSCAIAGFEAVRVMKPDWPVGDEPPDEIGAPASNAIRGRSR